LDEPFDRVLDAARANAPWAYRHLYESLAGAVSGYLRSQGARDVDDLTSEVFLGVFRRLGSFEGGEAAFRSWVFTIAHHRLVDDRRRRARRPDPGLLDGRLAEVVGGDVEDEVLARLGTEGVHRLLERLAPDQRDVLLLRVVGDLTIEQVAEAVGKRPGAVKALQRRGLAALRKIISDQGVPL
jgi:RNA polymerase sigma factor (sigma-70 family)